MPTTARDVVEASDAWNEQDQDDLTAFSLRYAAAVYPEGEDTMDGSIGSSAPHAQAGAM